MLLKIFIPLGCLILPVLIPLNRVDGKGTRYQNGTGSGSRWNVTGLDQLAWGNITPAHTHRYWAHLVMAVIVVFYVCAVFFDELRGYIRLRQAYLTSPQHRLRASATTVLVTAIPSGYLTLEALNSLFSVFPGGVRNIWINRNFDDLNEKVKARNEIALWLETAETDLIVKCKKAQLKAEARKAGKSYRKADGQEKATAGQSVSGLAAGPGISSGDPHEARTLNELLHRPSEERGRDMPENRTRTGVFNPAFAAVGFVGQGVGKLGKSVIGGLKKVDTGLDKTLARSGGFVATADDMLPPRQSTSPPSGDPVPGNDTTPESGPRPPTPEADQADRAMGPEPESPPKRPLWKKHDSKSREAPEPDSCPLTAPDSVASATKRTGSAKSNADKEEGCKRQSQKEGDDMDGDEYPIAYNEDFDNEDYGDPMWKKYIRPKDRDTMRLPIFGWSWMPSLWLIGKKVDTIDHCRKELARLNLEIEIDQQHPERFPLMNSAFIQFNHQVAAHMACQTVSHHLPKQMTPRVVEISPDDVIWDNMSIRWWERYLRTFGIIVLVCAMIIGWAFPVAFTGLLSQLTYVEGALPWLGWISKLPGWLISAVQGILPPLFLAILMALLPLILRFLSRTQGLHTGMAIELAVQNYFFAFLFVQLFLVVTIASSFSTVVNDFTNVTSWPQLLAQNIPKSSNYFFSYMILQAMSVSAGALVQIFSLVSWFILAPILDSTARRKWARTTNLNLMQWGTFFPFYTTLASIGK